ncbi:MAG TPA: TIGR03435 family protein [Bryobacteraceae bacterium]|nr:TIGR03435 family protein [Bryobacteraceae bacterium]
MKLWACGLAACVLFAQTVSFDAASIRPSAAPPGSSGINTSNGSLRAYNVTLRRCISGAYEIPEGQIIGGPKWLDENRYDIAARGPGHTEDMLKTLLADRFRLLMHPQTETRSGYVLTVAKGGIKAAETAPDTRPTTNSSRARIDAKGCPMSRLVQKLAAALGQPVVDETQDKRSFDFVLQWVPDEVMSKAPAGSDAANGPSLFTAVQEQLGLKLESRKIAVDVLMIDRAELPSEN